MSFNTSITNKCFRTPLLPGEGYGVSEYKDSLNEGFDWVYPPTGIGAEICYDLLHREIAVVLDSKTQRVYQINDLNALKDRMKESYLDGETIIAEVHPGMVAATNGEGVAIKHVESRTTIKGDKDQRSKTGFDVDGLPDDFRLDYAVYKDDEIDASWRRALNVDRHGDHVFSEEYEVRNIQIRRRIWGSSWILTRIQTLFETINKAKNESRMTETQHQLDLTSGALFRVTRNRHNPALNLVTGQSAGEYVSALTGPDTRSGSGVLFDDVGWSGVSTSPLNGDFTLRTWIMPLAGVVNTTYPLVIWTIGTLTISILQVGLDYRVRFFDGINLQDSDLDLTVNEWNLLVVSRLDDGILIWAGDTLIGDFPVSTPNYGTQITMGDLNNYGLFDSVVLPRAINQETVEYYYEQVIANKLSILPIF